MPIRQLDQEVQTMKRHGTTASAGVGAIALPSPLELAVSGRVKGVAQSVSAAIGEVDRKALTIALTLRADTHPNADPTKPALDYAYAAAKLAHPDGGWKEAADAGAKMGARRARAFGYGAADQQAVAMAAGKELAMACLLHDRLPVTVYMSLVAPWLAAFPRVLNAPGVGTRPFTEEEITMAQNAATPKPTARPKPSAKPDAPKPVVNSRTSKRVFWLQQKSSTGEFYLAYAEGGKIRRPGALHATKELALAEAKQRGWTVVDDRSAAGAPVAEKGAKAMRPPKQQPPTKPAGEPPARTKAVKADSRPKPAPAPEFDQRPGIERAAEAILDDAKTQGRTRRAPRGTVKSTIPGPGIAAGSTRTRGSRKTAATATAR